MVKSKKLIFLVKIGLILFLLYKFKIILRPVILNILEKIRLNKNKKGSGKINLEELNKLDLPFEFYSEQSKVGKKPKVNIPT